VDFAPPAPQRRRRLGRIALEESMDQLRLADEPIGDVRVAGRLTDVEVLEIEALAEPAQQALARPEDDRRDGRG
jgi:hypothetical protein